MTHAYYTAVSASCGLKAHSHVWATDKHFGLNHWVTLGSEPLINT